MVGSDAPQALEAAGLVVDVRDARGVQFGSHGRQTNIDVRGNYYAAAMPVHWPVLVGRAPLLADAFQERPDLVEATAAGADPGSTVITQVVTGDGGTGKTQLAASVFRQALPRLQVAVWVSATSRSAILAAYAQAWSLLHPGQPSSGDAEQDALALVGWLEVTDRPWAVALDDVQDPVDVRGLWPTGPAGRTLLTTRRRDPALTGHARTVVDVGVFTPDEACRFLARKLAGSQVPEVLDGASQLADDLGRLPLALAQAGAVILDDGITCADYRIRLADRSQRLSDVFCVDTGDEYERTIASTWSLAIERADTMAPAGLASNLLQFAAVLDPNGAPDILFTSPVVLTRSAASTPGSAGERTADNGVSGPPVGEISATDARKALRNLHRLSLITHDPAGRARAVRTHALTQRAALEHLPDRRQASLVRVAADALAQAWPDTDPDGDWWPVLRANTLALAEHHLDSLWEPATHEVLFRVGTTLGETGQVQAAITHFEQLARDASHRHGRDHPDTLTTRGNLARWRGTAGDASGAATALEQLLTDHLRVLGPNHPDTLTTRHNLAYWRGEAGDAEGAVGAFAQVLDDRLRILGPDHPDTLNSRHNLARWRGETGDAAGAAEAFAQVLDDRLRILGPDHPNTLATRHNHARWLARAGEIATAVAAGEALLRDQRRVLGPDHPNTQTTRHNLAHWRGEAGDPGAAVDELQDLLPDRLRVLGPDHPSTLNTRHLLAHWRGVNGDPASAVTALEGVLADRLRLLGPDHPKTLNTRHEIARWRGENGDPASAVAALTEVLIDRRRVHGSEHPSTLATRFQLARWQGRAGDPGGAASALADLLADRLRVLGDDHPDTLATREELAVWRETAEADGVTHRRPVGATHEPPAEDDLFGAE